MRETAFAQFLSKIPDVIRNCGTRNLFSKEKIENEVSSYISQFMEARIFLVNLHIDNSKNEHVSKYKNEALDLPFDQCFFERTDGLAYKLHLTGKFKESDNYDSSMDINIFFLLVKSIGTFLEIRSIVYVNGQKHLAIFDSNNIDPNTLFLKALLVQILRSMKDGQMAIEKTNIHQKIKINDVKYHHKIKTIIHVVKHRKYPFDKYQEHNDIEWTHRWEVAGHWRIIDGIGKDRHGQYIMNGLTWVIPHEKGDASKTLVKKIRVFNEATNDR